MNYAQALRNILFPYTPQAVRILDLGGEARKEKWGIDFPLATEIACHSAEKDVHRSAYQYNDYDIIYYPGSPVRQDFLLTLTGYFPALAPNGVLILDNLPNGEWSDVVYRSWSRLYPSTFCSVLDSEEKSGRKIMLALYR